MGEHSKGTFRFKYWAAWAKRPKTLTKYTKQGADKFVEILKRHGYEYEIEVI